MSYVKTELEAMVGSNEKIFWKGKPNKACYILEGIFNPCLIFAIIWGTFDLIFLLISGKLMADPDPAQRPVAIGVFLFILVHMTPVWIYLVSIIATFIRYMHTEYIVTDKGVYVSSGVFSYACNMKPFAELGRVNIHRGIIDQMIGVGDVVLTSNNVGDVYNKNSKTFYGIAIEDIREYKKVFNIIKKLQEDIYSDTMYPNALRPDSNPGYKTKYKGLD